MVVVVEKKEEVVFPEPSFHSLAVNLTTAQDITNVIRFF
jgi:hypothetical protein